MVYVLIFAAVVFAVVTFVLLVKFYFTNDRRMTSTTSGTVVRAEERVQVNEVERRTETEIVAKYRAAGKEFEVKKVIEGQKAKLFPAGRAVQVRYHPGEPEMSRIVL
jgi:hypothetical protein